MISKRRFLTSLLTAAGLILASAAAFAQTTAQTERAAASYLLAYGALAAGADTAVPSDTPIAAALARYQQILKSDAPAAQAVVAKATQDAVGRTPTVDEIKSLAGNTYAAIVQTHLRRLAAAPDEYLQVLNRSYRALYNRDAYTVEVDYWKSKPVTSFAMLVGCINHWGRRNQPGLMYTTGVAQVSINSDYLITVRLSPAVAQEARTAVGMALPSDRALARERGRNVIAPGAEEIASPGDIYFVAAGRASAVVMN